MRELFLRATEVNGVRRMSVDLPCKLVRNDTTDGMEYDCEYEFAGEITCEECLVNGGSQDPRKPRHDEEEV